MLRRYVFEAFCDNFLLQQQVVCFQGFERMYISLVLLFETKKLVGISLPSINYKQRSLASFQKTYARNLVTNTWIIS